MIHRELSLRLPNNAGALAGVVRVLGAEHVHVLAISLGEGGQLRLLVDNHLHAADLLRQHRHHVTEADVLVVDAAAGAGALRLIADAGINLNYSYGGASAVVLGVDDAIRASAASGV